MGRLNNFMNEAKSTYKVGKVTYTGNEIERYRHIWTLIEKDCARYLKDLRKASPSKRAPLMMWRGMKGKPEMGDIKPFEQRLPKDTPADWHECFDEAFYKVFGWYARSQVMFAFGDWNLAKGYGTPYMVFPADRYKFVWSDEIQDLYADKLQDGSWMEHLDIEDKMRDKYDDEYDEYSGNGYWEYPDDEFISLGSDRYDAVQTIIRELLEPLDEELTDLEDMDEDDLSESDKERIQELVAEKERIENSEDEIDEKLVWNPEKDIDEFREDYYQSISDGDEDIPDSYKQDIADIIVADYSEKNLRAAIMSEHEIMVSCKKYYFISEKYMELVMKSMGQPNYDPRQLEFDFMKKKRR